MSTAELKYSIHELVENINDNKSLKVIYNVLSKFSGEESNHITVLSAAEKKAVDEALKSVKKGRVHSHEKVMAGMKKKYPSLIK